MRYEHHCNGCGLDWLEDYGLHDPKPERCPECESGDVYRCVTTSGVVVFNGSGWASDGYHHNAPLESWGKQLKLYDRKEDIVRESKGEARARELNKLKRQNETIKRTFGPDAAITQTEADRKIKKAGEKAVKNIK